MDVHQAHQQTFKSFRQANLLELISSVNKRTWINLARTELGKSNIKVPSLLLVGDSSPFNEDAAELNSRLNPSITTFAKLQDRILTIDSFDKFICTGIRMIAICGTLLNPY